MTQEPVAWVSEDVCEGQYIDGRPRKIWWECEKGVGTAFYTTPPQPEQEPVAWMFQHDETGRMNYVSNDGVHNPTIFLEMNPRYALVCPLYTTPPQRTEQNFCSRCGKRVGGIDSIHTCTPPIKKNT